MKLTIEQERAIQAFVDSHQLTISSLRDDLIDHLCCVVEQNLGKGKPFEQLLQEAANDVAPNGLKSIEQKPSSC